MIELVQRYYTAEKHSALMGLGFGLVLMVVAVVLWRTSAAATLTRGMAYALLFAGVLQAATGGGYAATVSSRVTEATSAYSGRGDDEVKAQEVTRMQGVLSSGYIGGLTAFTAMLLIGLALVFISNEVPTRKGIGLALMVVGVLGHHVEAFSMQKNRQYFEDVQAFSR